EHGTLDADCFDEPTRAVLAATAELLERPRLSDGAFAALERHFAAREIVELLITVGYYMMVARLLESTAVDIDPPAGTAVVDSIRRRPPRASSSPPACVTTSSSGGRRDPSGLGRWGRGSRPTGRRCSCCTGSWSTPTPGTWSHLTSPRPAGTWSRSTG